MGHGLSLYRREVHVPLLIFPPSGTPVGQKVEVPVSLRDLAATILDLLRLEDRSPFPGRSLAPFCRSEPAAPRSQPVPLLCEVGHQKKIPMQGQIPATLGPLQSIVAEGRVYIRNHDGREELFDLLNDPLEQHNLIGQPGLSPPLDHFRGLLDQLLEPSGAAFTRSRLSRDVGPAVPAGQPSDWDRRAPERVSSRFRPAEPALHSRSPRRVDSTGR